MPKFINGRKDRIGDIYGKLTVIEYGGSINKKVSVWVCKCECGNIVSVRGGNLNTGNTISCGCISAELISNLSKKHGLSGTSEHSIWAGMKSRCLNKNNSAYENYGGRGIAICDRWLESFENFLEDMGERPSINLTLDRINNDGNYEKNNCRWGTKKEQSENRRSNVWYEHEGKKMIQKNWARYLGVNVKLFNKMLKRKSFIDAYNFYKIKSIQNG